MSDLFCNICALQFGKKYVFDLHLSLVHGEKIEVKKETPICEDKNISEKEFLKSAVAKPLKCDECHSVFKTKQNLKRHIQSVHEGKKQHKCSICDYTFSQKGHVKQHIESVHGGKKQHK